MRYFRILTDDKHFRARWFLDEPRASNGCEIDAREFTSAKRYSGPQPVYVPVQQTGRRVNFNLAAFDMPVVTEDIARLVQQLDPDAVQRFPVTIGSATKGCEILNVIVCEACVDEQHSEIMRWKSEDGRPEKVGRYRMVSNLTIDPTRTHNRHIFRVEDWEIALIVSEKVKDAIENLPNLGVVFQDVTAAEQPGMKRDRQC